MYLTDLAVACRKSGLDVVELPGWRTRGRPSYTGGFNPIGVGCHHTGSTSESRSYAEWMAYTGRSDLPAPLAQLALSGAGTVYVSAAGRANHGGTSGGVGGWLPRGDANELLLGIEAFNSGFEGWSAGQLDAYHRLCAALCDHYKWPRSHVAGHGEWSTTGKWDPGYDWKLIDMNRFRRGVAAVNSPEEDDVLSDEDVQRIAKAVWREAIPIEKGEERPAQLVLRWAANNAQRAADAIRGDKESADPKA